ncbi:MAG: hypothetical protein CVV05_18710 [Gammaproteobacteria bacterium HGW-Gammaproteobacteria-1]|jgi:hypothetical protein|nr:MAG: hypothetical protein CVV05_18710 [Gammaproteobacteria bacterium HGW-Gammaproteobacteria-1]
MRFLANTIMRGPMAAILVTSVTAMLGLLLPPLGYLSAAAVGLVTLRLGLAEAGKVVAGAVLTTAVLGMVMLGNALTPLAFLLVLWLPLLVTAWSLRRTSDLARSLLLAGLFGVMVVLGFHVGVDDPAGWWRGLLQRMTEQATAEQREVLLPALDEIAGLMTGMVGAAVALGVALSLFLARWWQAMLFNPGGFGREFRTLRLGRGPALVTVLLLALNWAQLPGIALLGDLLPLALLLSMVQGVAVVHGVVAGTGAKRGWLVAMYVMLLLPMVTTPTALTLAVAGMVDNWMDFRAYFGARNRNQQ